MADVAIHLINHGVHDKCWPNELWEARAINPDTRAIVSVVEYIGEPRDVDVAASFSAYTIMCIVRPVE